MQEVLDVCFLAEMHVRCSLHSGLDGVLRGVSFTPSFLRIRVPITAGWQRGLCRERSPGEGREEGSAAPPRREQLPELTPEGQGLLAGSLGTPRINPAADAQGSHPEDGLSPGGGRGPEGAQAALPFIQKCPGECQADRVCSGLASCPPAPPSLGWDVTGSEGSSWGGEVGEGRATTPPCSGGKRRHTVLDSSDSRQS